jgi:hypothetical protein
MHRKGYLTEAEATQPRSPRTPEELAKIKTDFEQCREEAHYLGATLTELNSDGSYRWTGNDRAANERLKKCMAARGRHIYGY